MDTSNEPNFTTVNIEQTVRPSYNQEPQYAPNEFMHLNMKYLKSPLGYLRIALIVLLFCGWVSAAAAPVDPSYTDDVRVAYLFFTIIEFFFSILVFVATLLNLLSFNDTLKKFPKDLVVAIHDLLFIIIMFALAIAAAAWQVGINFSPNTDNDLTSKYRTGAYASASFFAFVCWILYIITSILGFRAFVKNS